MVGKEERQSVREPQKLEGKVEGWRRRKRRKEQDGNRVAESGERERSAKG